MVSNSSTPSKLRLLPFTPSKKNIAIYLNMQKRIIGPWVETTGTAEEARSELAKKQAHFIELDAYKRVGFIAHEMRSEPEPHGYIWELLISPDFRGNRFGVQALQQVLHEYYLTVPVRLKVHPRNTPAIRTYFDCGFMIDRWIEAENESGPRLIMIRNR
jgi:ribosomal protein S18 acetylase RimI-like enzyme